MRALKRLVTTSAILALAVSLLQVTASASVNDTLVNPNPANYTPNVLDDGVSHSAVYALASAAGTTYAGGRFQNVQNAGGTTTYTRNNLMSFSSTTGVMTNFAPNVNGDVWSIVTAGSSVYVGGQFTNVNGVSRRAVVKLDATTGAVDPGFNAKLPSGRVTEMDLVDGRLIIAGTIPRKLMAINPATGQDTGYINIAITGNVGDGGTQVYKFTVNASHTRLVGIGNFLTVGGQSRTRAFMLNLDTTAASVSSWYYTPFANRCRGSRLNYVQDVDFSPDGSYFVVVSTGWVPLQGGLNRDVCDVAARFETNLPNPTRPTWMNYTGGDTLHAVAVTNAAVYAQGHQRWFSNPFGVDNAGAGAIPRPGIGALNPTNGSVLDWNPTKTRAVGGRDFLITTDGLWVGSDGALFNGERRDNIAFCPAL